MTSISRRSFLNSAAGATVLGLSGLAGCGYPRRGASDVSLSPTTWGDGVVDRYLAQDDTPRLGGDAKRRRPDVGRHVEGRRGGIVQGGL